MMRVSQSSLIKVALDKAAGSDKYTSKEQIITAVVDELGVPRPSVRRVKNELIEEYKQKVAVLS
jgi:hypothetical protein